MAKALSRKVTIYIDGREVKSTISSLNAELKKLQAQQKNMVIGSEEYIKTSMKIKEITAVINEQKRAVNGLGNEWKSTTTRVAEFANMVTGLNSAFNMIDLGIGKVKDLAKAAAELDDVYADVMKTTGLSHEQVEKLNAAFAKMDTRTSREQLNQLAYEAGKLGINSEEAVAGFVSAADKINIALGDVLGEGAMVTIGKLSGVYEQSTKQLADSAGDIEAQMLKIGSAINMLGQSSTANEHYLVDFMGRLGGIATQAGLSADQILGYASALDQDMQKVEMSATAFQKLIQQMIKKPEEFVQAARMPMAEFQKLMETDMNAAIQKVLQGFNEMGGLNQLIPIFKDMGLDGARAASVIAAMASSLDKITEAQRIANDELETGSSVINEFNTKNNTLQAQAEKSKKRFEEIRIELGNELYPVLIHLQKTGTVLMKGFAGLIQLVKENKAILPGLIALMANWTRVKLLNFAANSKLIASAKSLLGIEKLKGHQDDINTARILKKTAAEEANRLAVLKSELAEQRKIAAMKVEMYDYDGLTKKMIAQERVRELEVQVTRQATIATEADTRAVQARKAAFASTPWGLVITALTTIAALTVSIVKNSSAWKLSQSIKEAGRAAGEAEGKVKILVDQLREAEKGSAQYRTALNQLKQEYPEIIALHEDETGAIRDIEAAYKDLSKAARQSAFDRVYAEKTAEAYGELAAKVAETVDDIMKYNAPLTYPGGRMPSEETLQKVRKILGEELNMVASGKKAADAAETSIRKRVHELGVDFAAVSIALSTGVREIGEAYQETEKTVQNLKDALKPDDTDTFDFGDKSLKELQDEMTTLNTTIAQQKKLWEDNKDIQTEGAQQTAKNAKESLSYLYRYQAALKAAIKEKSKGGTTATTTTGDFGTGESEKERKAREKAEAAWQRFSQSYDQAMSKINARTLTGIEAIGAEIDAATQKMRTDLEAIDKTAHPEAAKMLTDLEAATEAWKRTKIDEYIAKTNKEIDKLAKSTAKQGKTELDKVRKATEDLNQKFRDVDATIAQLTTDREILAAKDDDKSKEQLANIDAQIARFKELRSLMVGAAFAEIAPTVKNPFQKQEQQMNSFSYAENRAKALAKVQEELEKYATALEDAIAAEEEMERVATANGNEEEAKKHREAAAALKKEQDGLKGVGEEAEKLAKQKALSVTLNKWADAVEEFGSRALSVFSNINTILSNISQQHLQELEDQKDEEIKMLDDQLEQGLISQESYDKRKQELEDDYREKAHEAELEDWRRQKAYGWSEAIINAAVAATKLWAGEGTTAYKVAMSALLAAEMATQIAAIESQPEPRAKGGYVESERIYRVGEAGREWVASNRLLNDPQTAPLIQALESYQRGNVRALGDIPMAQLNMPVVTAAARELGRRATTSPVTHAAAATRGDDMLSVMRELAKYLEDPRNRQAVISRQTMTDFDNNENFLRNHARLG